MKHIFLIICLIIMVECISAQDTLSAYKPKDRYGIWLVPALSGNIYGVAVGPFGSEAICNLPYTKYSHGLNLQIPGQGIFQTFYVNTGHIKENYTEENQEKLLSLYDSTYKKALHNGLLLSILGTFTDQVNGISVSGWMSQGRTINGISVNALWNMYAEINGLSIGCVNHAIKLNGLQLGFFNTANDLRGIQIGIWNNNSKRSFPVVNWNFSSPLLIKVFNERELETVNRIIAYYDRFVYKHTDSSLTTGEAYMEFLNKNGVSSLNAGHFDSIVPIEGRIDLFNSLDKEILSEFVVAQDSIWYYDKKTKERIKVHIPYYFSFNNQGKYMLLLKKLSKRKQFYRQYYKGVQNCADFCPSTYVSLLLDYRKINFTKKEERLTFIVPFLFLNETFYVQD